MNESYFSESNLLIDATAVSLEEKWPTLWKSQQFRGVTPRQAFLVSDDKSGYLGFPNGQQGLIFDIFENEVLQTNYNVEIEADDVLLSHDHIAYHYVIRNTDGFIQIARADFTPTESSIEEFRFICRQTNQIILSSEECQHRRSFGNVTSGFVADGMVYLITDHTVHIFDEEILFHNLHFVDQQEIEYRKFFECEIPVVYPRTTVVPVKVWIQFSFIILGILLCCSLPLMLIFFANLKVFTGRRSGLNNPENKENQQINCGKVDAPNNKESSTSKVNNN